MNKVLVTGGLGIVGSFVCRALLATSRQPLIYDLGAETGLVGDIVRDCVIERGDVRDLPRLLGVISQHKPVSIIHLAGQLYAQVEQFPWSSLHANFMGTTQLFECARLMGISRVVFASSKHVYGPVGQKHQHPTYEPVAEDHPREPNLFYGKLKRACEDVADHYARLYGLDIIALRFASGFGPSRFRPHDQGAMVATLIEAAIAKHPFRIESGAEQRDDLCYFGEYANGVLAALDSIARPGTFRAYNIGSSDLISLREMIGVLQDLHPSWSAAAGPGLDYRRRGSASYFGLAIDKARAELDFRPKFDFRRGAMDYADTLARLNHGIS